MTPAQVPAPAREKITDKMVLLVIVIGLILLLGGVVLGTFLTARPNYTFPNWAENVLVALVTGGLLKFGDALSALVALSNGRQVERLGNQLANTTPVDGPSGSESDPLHVAGAETGSKPVSTVQKRARP